MKNQSIILAVLLYLTKSAFTQSLNWNWAANAGSINRGIAADNNGNFYISGWFTNTTSIAGVITLSTLTQYASDLYVAKLNSSGTPQWGCVVGSSNIAAQREIFDMDVDANGNAYITGYFNGNMIVGSNTLVGSGSSNVFLLKFDANGNYVWGRRMNNNNGYGYGVKVDPSGNPVITGIFSGTLSAETHTLTGPGIGSSIFVVKYDANGNYLWSMKGGNGGANFAFDLDIDNSGNIYITGKLDMSNQSIGSQTVNIPNGGLFCAKINPTGTTTCIKSISNFSGFDVKILSNSDIAVLGNFVGTVTVGSQTFISNGVSDGALIKFTNDNQNSQNVYDWIKTFGGSSSDLNNVIGKLAVKGNEVFVGAVSYTNLTVGSNTYTLHNSGSGYIIKSDLNGNLQYVGNFNTNVSSELESIAADANYIYVGGSVSNTTTLGSFNLDWGGFVGKIGTGPANVVELKSTHDKVLQVHPVPSDGHLMLNAVNEMEIRIIDVHGKILRSQKLQSGMQELNMNLPKGIYFVSVPDTGEYHKIIIQ